MFYENLKDLKAVIPGVGIQEADVPYLICLHMSGCHLKVDQGVGIAVSMASSPRLLVVRGF